MGDIDGDNLPDVAVAVYLGPAGFSEPGRAKVYLNNGEGAFNTIPDWESGERFYSFSLSLGDADGDGDLDLACACGEDYFNHPEQQRIFFNKNGQLETVSTWRSDETGYALDVVWSDLDDDGDLDPVFCGSSTPIRVYRNNQTDGGGIETSAWWKSGDLPQFGNTVDTGDINGDGYPEIAVADNNQFGGEGRFKVYANHGDSLATEPFWLSSTGGYGSHVSWIDLDRDEDLDLEAGRWWGTCRIYPNVNASLTTIPVWESATISVIENMFWGDVDNDGLRHDGHMTVSGDGRRNLFYFDTHPIRSIIQVRVDNNMIPPSAYIANLSDGWISFSTPPAQGQYNIDIRYIYSEDIDLGVTNWDPYIGNYIFLNTVSSCTPMPNAPVVSLMVYPNPIHTWASIQCTNVEALSPRLSIYDIEGRLVKVLESLSTERGDVDWYWDRHDYRGRTVSAGVYVAAVSDNDQTQSIRLIVTH